MQQVADHLLVFQEVKVAPLLAFEQTRPSIKVAVLLFLFVHSSLTEAVVFSPHDFVVAHQKGLHQGLKKLAVQYRHIY